MFITPIHILPIPFPTPARNGGLVPPWLTRDMGYTATVPTNAAQAGWRLVIR
jgi:hypothetical protein